MQFLNIFIGLGAFNNDNFNEIPYIKKTKQTLLLLKTELQDFNIKFEKIENLNYLDKGGKLDDRLNLIFYDEKEKIPSYKNELIQKIQTFIDFFFNKLEKVLNYLNLCFSKDENKKKLYNEMKSAMNTINLKDSIDYINSHTEINEVYDNSIKILSYMDSKIFNNIFTNERKNENKGDEEILDDTINQFKTIGTNFLTNFSEIPNLKKILNSFENREKIRNELECLKVLLLNISEINIQKKEIYIFSK